MPHFYEKCHKSDPPKNLTLRGVIAIKLFTKMNFYGTFDLPVHFFETVPFPEFSEQ